MKKLKNLLMMLLVLAIPVSMFAACGKSEIKNIEVKGGLIDEAVLIKGSQFPQDLKVNVVYENKNKGKEEIVTSEMVTGFNSATCGIKDVTITFSEKTFKFTVCIVDIIVDGQATTESSTVKNTISSAIESALDDNYIYLKAQTFNENVTVSKPLTIYGANAGINPNNADMSASKRKTESIFKGEFSVAQNVGDVFFDGIRFTNNKEDEKGGIITATTGFTNKIVSVKNCISENSRVQNAFFTFMQGKVNNESKAVFINNRVINAIATEDMTGLASGGTSALYIGRVNDIEVTGNYFTRTAAGFNDSNAGINIGTPTGETVIKNNLVNNMAIILATNGGEKVKSENFSGNRITGTLRDGKSAILEFATTRLISEIQDIIKNNPTPSSTLGYVLNGSPAILQTGETIETVVNKANLQAAIDDATANSIIYVAASTASISSLPSVSGITLIVADSTTITGDGATGINGQGTYLFNGTTWVKQ